MKFDGIKKIGVVALCFSGTSIASDVAVVMQPISNFAIDQTEVTVAQFQAYIRATGVVTSAEKAGGGSTFEAGWEHRRGWTWKAPFGSAAAPNEPVVHVTYDEAAAFCKWAGKRLPTDAQWIEAAYTEKRQNPTGDFIRGVTYPFPVGQTSIGANCLGDCGITPTVSNAKTSRGRGHAPVATTKQGVNGLFDMGGNVWEWVDSGDSEQKRTRGGSWWYGQDAMRADYLQSKHRNTSVVYIGFRCAKNL
jgi:formylglycine-generating enzyme